MTTFILMVAARGALPVIKRGCFEVIAQVQGRRDCVKVFQLNLVSFSLLEIHRIQKKSASVDGKKVTMFSFEGDFKTRPKVSLGGASKKVRARSTWRVVAHERKTSFC